MARKKEKDVKLSDMPVEELTRALEKTTEDLFKLRFRAASAPLKNPMQIQNLRREVARINTFINQKSSQPAVASVAKPIRKQGK